MLTDNLISELAAFCARSGYSDLAGSFVATEESPEGFDIEVSVEMMIKPSGNYFIWFVNPFNSQVFGTYHDGAGKGRINLGATVSSEEKDAVIQSIYNKI